MTEEGTRVMKDGEIRKQVSKGEYVKVVSKEIKAHCYFLGPLYWCKDTA